MYLEAGKMGSTLQENCKAVYTYVNPSLECFTPVIFVTLFVTFHDDITSLKPCRASCQLASSPPASRQPALHGGGEIGRQPCTSRGEPIRPPCPTRTTINLYAFAHRPRQIRGKIVRYRQDFREEPNHVRESQRQSDRLIAR